ncbi:MAG: transglutaminase-like domain-containing protein [Balneolaceae bacterium]|nr:transglutaminase-like domain-containing protein [Balneolaceae bacterium]
MPTKTEIESLVTLLDDPDPYVHSQVRNRLFELGQQAVPLLDQQKSETKDDSERELINEIIQYITYGNLEEDFLDLLGEGIDDLEKLEKAIFILSRFDNPTLRDEEYRKKLDRFAEMIANRIQYEPDENQRMHYLLDFVFEELNFTGSTVDYYNPGNSYLNRVIDRRQGLPISLGMIVLFLARRLDLPFYGVNMPIHFMLRFKGEREEMLIDPFDNGKVVSYNQCYFFLKQNGVEPKSKHFEAAGESEILARSIRNLIQSYSKLNAERKVEGLKKLLGTVEMTYK